MNITLDISQYLHKFKKYPKATTLFPPTSKEITYALLHKVCPICSKRLYQNRKGDKWFCKSKVSNDKFMILDSTLKKYW